MQDKTRVISGALDQAAEEVKDLPELVGLGLKVVSDPVGEKDELISFAQNMSWQKAKDFAIEAAQSTVQYDYLTNPKPSINFTARVVWGFPLSNWQREGQPSNSLPLPKKSLIFWLCGIG